MNIRVDSSVVLPRTQLLIGGAWGDAVGRKRFATINPATEEPIAEVSQATAADIDAAVAAARDALKRGPWPAMTGAQRGRILNRLAAIMRERVEELVLLESVDGGKPIAATRRMDLPAAIDCLEYYAGWADKIAGEVVPTRRDALTYVQRVPVGVVAVIVPWNFALMNAVWKIAPALACGCTVVLKPAELTPLSALWLGAAALEAGLPAGVLNIVPGYGTEAGTALVSHPGVEQNLLHRFAADRTVHHARRGREHHQDRAGARRQVRERGLRRRRSRRCGAPDCVGRVLQCRAGLLGRDARGGRSFDP